MPVEALPNVSAADTAAGTPGVVDLWLLPTAAIDEAGLWADYVAQLGPEEHERYLRFSAPLARRLFVAGRALARHALAQYAPIPAAEWRFAIAPGGRPAVANPLDRPLHFNLAHTAGLVVCVVARAHARIGVDVEAAGRTGRGEAMSRLVFTEAEARALEALPEAERQHRFLTIWTLKEACLKACGAGLVFGLDRVSFELGDAAPAARFEPATGETSGNWRFAALSAPPGHLVAVGADTGGAALDLRCDVTLPLG